MGKLAGGGAFGGPPRTSSSWIRTTVVMSRAARVQPLYGLDSGSIARSAAPRGFGSADAPFRRSRVSARPSAPPAPSWRASGNHVGRHQSETPRFSPDFVKKSAATSCASRYGGAVVVAVRYPLPGRAKRSPSGLRAGRAALKSNACLRYVRARECSMCSMGSTRDRSLDHAVSLVGHRECRVGPVHLCSAAGRWKRRIHGQQVDVGSLSACGLYRPSSEEVISSFSAFGYRGVHSGDVGSLLSGANAIATSPACDAATKTSVWLVGTIIDYQFVGGKAPAA